MSIEKDALARLIFLNRIVSKELKYLQQTDERLFPEELKPDVVQDLLIDIELGERVDAFVGRFGRLQDTFGDKFLPALLNALGESPRTLLDNLDKAERLNWIQSSDEWFDIRRLRNQMVNEYIESAQVFVDALNKAHRFVPAMATSVERLQAQLSEFLVVSESKAFKNI